MLTNRKLLLGTLLVVLGYLVFVFGWATRPMQDYVPVGVDWTPTVQTPPAAQHRVSQRVSCNSAFASESVRGEPPTLLAQPKDRPALAFERTPCDLVHADARRLVALNTLIAIGLLGGIGVLWVRRRRDVVPFVPSSTAAA